MDKPRFVYITYIRSTRERVWQALTDNTMVSEYWFGHRIESDWTIGGSLRFYDGDKLVHDDKVLACEPPALLSYSWRPLHPGFENEAASRVTFTLEQAGPQVKLTMVHDAFDPAGTMMQAVSRGWPVVLSGLKSLLEAGRAAKINAAQMGPPDMADPGKNGQDTVYVTYIAAPAEAVWDALTRSEFTSRYFFGRTVESDWKQGSDWVLRMPEGRVDVKGKVLISEPPRLLKVTWQVDWLDELRDLPETYVEYAIEPLGDRLARLTLRETRAAPIPEWMLEGGRQGWPAIFSSLKSLLETGQEIRIEMKPPEQPAQAVSGTK